MEEVSRYITDGFHDGGIDLIFFDGKERVLYLVQAKWHSDGNGGICLGDALKFISGVRKVLENDLDDLNDRVKAQRLNIEEALYDANAKFVLVLAHTGQEDLGGEVNRALEDYISEQNDTSELMSLRVLKQVDLHRAVAAGVTGTPIPMEVQLVSWGQVREPHYAVYGQVCASDVAGWLEEHGPRLFETNLRHFLGRSTVNQDIVSTLLHRPDEFWYRNNGITVVATTLAKKPIGGNSTEYGIFDCTGFCVVNGAQTVGSIHAASLQDRDKVAKAKVHVRIISVAEGEEGFSSEVTRCTNTQNSIEKRDFVALDPEQERIRQELHIEGVHYLVKAGMVVGAAVPTFDLVEATVALACANEDVSLAVQAKREISKLWEDIAKAPYRQLFNKGLTGPALWEIVKTVREVDKVLQAEATRLNGRDALICVHGNRFIQWAVLRELKIRPGVQFSSISDDVREVVLVVVGKVISSVMAHYAESYPASLFKNLGKCRALAKYVSSDNS